MEYLIEVLKEDLENAGMKINFNNMQFMIIEEKGNDINIGDQQIKHHEMSYYRKW